MSEVDPSLKKNIYTEFVGTFVHSKVRVLSHSYNNFTSSCDLRESERSNLTQHVYKFSR
jgi:hypothetical protein